MRNKRILVTGGSSGIGLAMVRRCIEEEAEVISVDIAENALREENLSCFRVDLASTGQVDGLCRRLEQAGKAPDVLVCNAGMGVHQSLCEGDPDQWRQAIDLNLTANLRLVRRLVPNMRVRGEGDVVFVSSVAAINPHPLDAVYGASKSALDTVAEALRLEVQPRVRVTSIVPGVVNTAFFENRLGGHAGSKEPRGAQFRQTVESIGWGAIEPEEVADIMVYALTRRRGIALNRIVVRPSAQPM